LKANGTAASEKLPGSSAHRPGATTWKLAAHSRSTNPTVQSDTGTIFSAGRRDKILASFVWESGSIQLGAASPSCPCARRARFHWRQPATFDQSRTLRPPADLALLAAALWSNQTDGAALFRCSNQRSAASLACFTPGVANREPACASVRHTGQTSATHCCRAIGLSLFFLSFIFPLDGHPPTLASAASLLSSPRPPSLRRP
jgi:hypothetical protein